MKKFACIIAFAAFAVSLSSATAQQKVQPPASKSVDPLKGLSVSRDNMKGIAWYEHPASPKHRNINGFYLYFGKSEDGTFTPLHLVAQYAADDWLFIKRAWAKADGVTVDIPQESKRMLGWERDHSGGTIFEWSDASVTSPAEIASTRTLANAKSVTVRYEGNQYYNDKTLTAAQLKAMRDVISAYEAATGKPWK